MPVDLSQFAPEPAKPTGPICYRCKQPMPPLSDELLALARSAGGVTLTHEVCPGDEVVDDRRLFEVRVQIVELTPTTTEAADGEKVDAAEPVELIRFVASERAVDLDSAMRPLAEALGVKWLQAEKNARLADDAGL